MPWIAAERNADEDQVCSGTDSRCGVKKLPDITSWMWPSESMASQGTRLCHNAFAASGRCARHIISAAAAVLKAHTLPFAYPVGS